MNSVTLLMRRLVAITKQEGRIPAFPQIMATVNHYGAAKQLTYDQRIATLNKMCEALSRL